MKNQVAMSKREERSIVRDLTDKGYSARRQPGSGNRAVDLQHDICWRDSPIGTVLIEDKYRDKNQWKTLDGWRQGADILTVRCARGERMAFLPWETLLALLPQGEAEEPPKRKIPSRPFQKRTMGKMLG